MKKKIGLLLGLIAVVALLAALAGCTGSDTGSNASKTSYKIAVPSDTTNEARALQLLQAQGLITLKDGVGLTATKNDIVDNPYNIEIVEAEAANLPRMLPDVDFAVINGNYALSAGIDTSTALAGEDANSDAAIEYANIIAVRAEDIGSEKTLVLVNALQSAQVQQYITDTFKGAVVPVNVPANLVSDGKTPADKVITVGASPSPHEQILEFARPLIEAQGYTLNIIEFSDYVQPNVALSEGDLDANYFQHEPYLDDYNKENGTTLVSAGKIHFEPLCIYPGKMSSLDDIKK